MRSLLKIGPNQPGRIVKLRDNGIQVLGYLRSKLAVRILFDGLNEPACECFIAHELAVMNLPKAPFQTKTWDQAVKTQGIAKWKSWWAENKDQYQD